MMQSLRRTNRIIRYWFSLFLTIVLTTMSWNTVDAVETIGSLLTNSGFESGTAEGWSSNGGAAVSVTSSQSNVYTGNYAAKITNRVAEGDGIRQDITGKLVPGSTYYIAACIKQVQAENPVDASFTLRIDRKVGGQWIIGDMESKILVPSVGYHRISGVYTLVDNGTAVEELALVITSDHQTQSFFLDETSLMLLESGVFNTDAAGVERTGADAVRLIYTDILLTDDVDGYRTPTDWQNISTGSNRHYYQGIGTGTRTVEAGSDTWTNYFVSVDVVPESFVYLGNIGIRLRRDGSGNSYSLKYENKKNRLEIYLNLQGGSSLIGYSDTVLLDEGTTYNLKFSADGPTLKAYLDGIEMISVNNTFVTGGSFELFTTRTTASFDNVTVYDIDTSSIVFEDDFEDGDEIGWIEKVYVPAMYSRLEGLDGMGIPVVLSLKWRDPDTGKSYIPTGTYETEKLSDVDTFLDTVGKYISVFAVENEPIFAYTTSDKTVDAQGEIPAIQWMKTVAAQVKQSVDENPADLSQVKVASGAFGWIEKEYKNENNDMNSEFTEKMFQWVNEDPNVDFVDFHAHVHDIIQFKQIVDYMRIHSTKPLICTEWSEALALKVWKDQLIDSSFAQAFGVSGSLTNAQYISECYDAPVTKVEWDAFVDTAPLNPAFMQEALDSLLENGVVLSMYGAYMQYGSTLFDSKQLYASWTVELDSEGNFQENSYFPEQFQSLRTSLPFIDAGLLSDDFEDGDMVGWIVDGGSWSVNTLEGNMMVQSAASGTGYTVAGGDHQNSSIEAKVLPTSFGTNAGTLGLNLRYTDKDNRYTAMYRDSGSKAKKFAIIKKVGGVQTEIALSDVVDDIHVGASSIWSFSAVGETLSLYVDGKLVLQTTDTSLTSGKVGVMTYDATAGFDNINLKEVVLDDFNDSNADGWITSGGTWSVDTVTGMYEQSSTSGSCTSYLDIQPMNDLSFGVTVRPENIGSSFGLLARYIDNNNNYRFVYQKGSTDEMKIIRKTGGVQTTLATVPYSMTAGVNYDMEVVVEGYNMLLYVDGELVLSAVDKNMAIDAGKVALITYNSAVKWDDIILNQR